MLDYAAVLAISDVCLVAQPSNSPFVVPSSDVDVSRQECLIICLRVHAHSSRALYPNPKSSFGVAGKPSSIPAQPFCSVMLLLFLSVIEGVCSLSLLGVPALSCSCWILPGLQLGPLYELYEY